MIKSPLDLHVLGTPPAFVLSQDQTLMFNPLNHSFEQYQLKLLTVVLRFLFLYRFQGSALSQVLCSRASLYIIAQFLWGVNTFFQIFLNFFCEFVFHESFIA